MYENISTCFDTIPTATAEGSPLLIKKELSDNTFTALFWMCCVPYLNGCVGDKIIAYYGSPTEVLSAPEASLRCNLPPSIAESLIGSRAGKQYLDVLHSFYERGGIFLPREHPLFPPSLRTIPDAPLGMFLMGNLPDYSRLQVGIIGARECSGYGKQIGSQLGNYLGNQKVTVVSGMARGIDGIAQQAALDAGGFSIGVLGSGVDVCYPPSNRVLYDALLERGCLLSLYGPGQPALPKHFPPRNRIVSGLSKAIVVIEARQKSGTLITVDMALEQGREVYAVPARLTDRLSDGCNGLIGQGASVYLSPSLFLSEVLGESHSSKAHRDFDGSPIEEVSPEGEMGIIYRVLDYQPKSVDEIWNLLQPKFTISELMMYLMQMVLAGFVNQEGNGSFCKRIVTK